MSRIKMIVAALGSIAAIPSMAQDASMWKLSGFGTVAATHFSREDADFTGASGINVQNGAGRKESFSINPDSKLGAQLRFTPFQSLEITLQGIAKQTPRDDWMPTLEWANIKYSINDNFAVRMGRIGAPFFMTSDYRQVNYTSVALRPSTEVYNQVPVTAADVLEGIAKFDIASGQLTLQGGAGRVKADSVPSDETLRDVDKIEIKDFHYLNATYETGPWTVRAGYSAGKLSWDLAGLQGVFNKLSASGATGKAIRDRYEIKDADSSFSGIGVTYNPGDLIVSSEYVMRRSEKSFNNADAWTFLAGYRIGAWTPFISYGEAKTKNRIVANDVTGAFAPFRPYLQGLADISVRDQATTSLGVRWDFYKNLALKAQFDHVVPKEPSNAGMLKDTAGGYPTRASGNAFAVALDFIF